MRLFLLSASVQFFLGPKVQMSAIALGELGTSGNLKWAIIEGITCEKPGHHWWNLKAGRASPASDAAFRFRGGLCLTKLE